MHTLRCLFPTCRAPKMGRLVALFLLTPALAVASGNLGTITSGVMPPIDANSVSLPFSVAGEDFTAGENFTASGALTWPINEGPVGLGNPMNLLYPFVMTWNQNSDNGLTIEFAVNGIPWGIPPGPQAQGGGFASAGFHAEAPKGTMPGALPFAFDATFIGMPLTSIQPGVNCLNTPCTRWDIHGGGTVVLDWVDYPNAPDGTFMINRATFTFGVPEPSTESLLLVAFAWLAVIGRRRASHMTRFPAEDTRAQRGFGAK